MLKHLAIFNREAVEAIFGGKKKIDGRFSQIKIAPFLKVAAGDVVIMKIAGEKIVGQFTVDRVLYFDHPRAFEVDEIRKKYGRDLALAGTFWLDHEKVNYATLMFIKTVTKFIIPPEVTKHDLRPWVVLG